MFCSRYQKRPAVLAAVALLLAAAAVHPESGLAAAEIVIDGVLHVQNGSRPARGTETVILDELWRAGGDTDSDTFFGLVTRVVTDRLGRIYLLDPQQATVHVFSPEGEALGTIFRQGEGPGEIGFVRDLCLMPDGTLGAVQFASQRTIVIVSADGDPVGNIELENKGVPALWAEGSVCRGGNMVLAMVENRSGTKPSAGSRNSFLASYDKNGNELVRYVQNSRDYDYEHMVFEEKENFLDFMWTFTVGPDGRVYAMPERNRYAITVFGRDGSIDRIIERQFESLARNEESAGRMRRLAERRFRTAPFEVDYRFEKTEPDVAWFCRGLQVDDDGNLWVRHSRSDLDQRDGVMLTLDVFDAGGRFDRQVSFQCRESARYSGFFFVGNDRVLLVKSFADSVRDWFGGGRGSIGDGNDTEEPEAVEIICYRMRKTS